jgi:hypothetical protein
MIPTSHKLNRKNENETQQPGMFVRSLSQPHFLAFIFTALVLLVIQIKSLFNAEVSEAAYDLHALIHPLAETKQQTHKNRRPSTTTIKLPTTRRQLVFVAPRVSRFAYAFLIAGCDADKPTYRGFLYNVLVSAHMLKSNGSTADVIVLVQMSQRAATNTSLPREEEHMLNELGVRIHYLPTPNVDTFYSAMLAKFSILDLMEYERVLYLDADIMPLCNLDYLFELSTTGLLKENMVIAWWKEPASGGCFMLTPGRGEYNKLQAIVAKQHDTSRRWPHFDPIQGWGHAIQPTDHWMSLLGHRGTNWTFQVRCKNLWTKLVLHPSTIHVIQLNLRLERWSTVCFCRSRAFVSLGQVCQTQCFHRLRSRVVELVREEGSVGARDTSQRVGQFHVPQVSLGKSERDRSCTHDKASVS